MARRTREIWRNLIQQLERSGKSAEEFATERDSPLGTLRGWIYRLKREQQEEAAHILPVTVIASTAPMARPSDDGGVEVMLLRFPSSATSEVIADLVSRLRRC